MQHTAETLSGVVISQLAHKGAPVVYGGSPSIFDMKRGTTPMGAIETMMIDSSYAQIGKFLGLPTHAYMGLSDAKRVDYQSGFETGMGIILAGLTGINMVSGAGMLDFENCQSLEKLVLDNEIIGMARRLIRGIPDVDGLMAIDIIREIIEKKGNFLSHPTTVKEFRKEFFFPGPAVDRSVLGEWEKEKKDVHRRVKDVIDKVLARSDAYELDSERSKRLKDIMAGHAKTYGVDRTVTVYRITL